MGSGGAQLHTVMQGPRLPSGDAAWLDTWSPMSQQGGMKERGSTREMFYGPGLKGAYITSAHVPLAPPASRELGSIAFLPAQRKTKCYGGRITLSREL